MIKNRCYMRTGLVPVFYCAAFIMPSLSYAADPVATVEANRKIMYGTAAVRPTPEAFDLASRGMCYVATDTGTVTEWTGTAWITTATCPGSATTSTNNAAGQYADDADFTDDTSVSVLAGGVAESTATTVTDGDIGAFGMTLSRSLKTTITDSSGDSAVDATANAVRTTAYVTENAATVAAADIDQTGAKTILTVDVGAVAASRLYCIFQNTDVAANTTLDEFNIYLAPAGYTATSMPVAYTEADFASPSGALLMVRTGAGGDTTDATPDTTLDESDYMIVWLDVSGMDSVTFQASAAADNAAVDAKCTYN